MTHLAI